MQEVEIRTGNKRRDLEMLLRDVGLVLGKSRLELFLARDIKDNKKASTATLLRKD